MTRILRVFCHASKKYLRYYSIKYVPKSPDKYTDTVNLPKTKFPQQLSARERMELEKALVNGHFSIAYSHQEKQNRKPAFVLHDGPPYANGDLHMGHAVNKILKDITIRYNVTKGQQIEFILGWDCHGLPIELKAISGDTNASPVEIRQASRKFAMDTVLRQSQEFRSWGIMGNWTNPKYSYHTLDPQFVQGQLKMFLDFYNQKIVYRDLKPVYWSASSRTALAEAELEYDPKYVSPSVVLRFQLVNLPACLGDFDKVYALVWTTTPWTLPTNQAICYNEQHNYSVVYLNSDSTEHYLLGSSLIESFEEMTGLQVSEIRKMKGSDLKGCTYKHPIDKCLQLPFLNSSHVEESKGTGLVHTAPAHGTDDFVVSLKYNLPVKCFVDTSGEYTSEAPSFLVGRNVLVEGQELVLQYIAEDIMYYGKFEHSYPIDWRTKKPVITRASEQWFIDTEILKDRAIEQLKNIKLYPSASSDINKQTLITHLNKRPYWCISRQRSWGVPIPVFYEKRTGKAIVNADAINYICNKVAQEKNIDFWWKVPLEDLIPQDILKNIAQGPEDLVKGLDIFDIWFDSGSSWANVLEGQKVADLYLEGCDQFSGWFQSSLLTSVASRGHAPFRSLFVHGFTVDNKGRKMSKSIGNVISPKDIINKHGVDLLRWWVAAHGTQNPLIEVSENLLEQTAGSLKKVRSILKYLNGIVGDDSKSKNSNAREPKNLTYLDRYFLSSLLSFNDGVENSFSVYEYNRVTSQIMNFISNEISSIYILLSKDRIYCGTPEQIAIGRYVFAKCYEIVCKILWPLVPFMVEESWGYYNNKPFHEANVEINRQWKDEIAEKTIREVLDIRQCIHQKAGDAKPWTIAVNITCGNEIFSLLKNLQRTPVSKNSELCELLQASKVILKEDPARTDLNVDVHRETLIMCPRCRRFSVEIADTICKRCEDVLHIET